MAVVLNHPRVGSFANRIGEVLWCLFRNRRADSMKKFQERESDDANHTWRLAAVELHQVAHTFRLATMTTDQETLSDSKARSLLPVRTVNFGWTHWGKDER